MPNAPEQSGDWEAVTESGGRVVRRRVYTIPPENGVPASEKKSDSGGTPANSKQPKKKKPISRQQRMLRQMKAQRELEDQQHAITGSATDGALKSQMFRYFKVMWVIITIGGGLLFMYAPDTFYKWILYSKPKLADRSLMTIYPAKLRVRKQLPLFYMAYAVATPENEAARNAVKHVAELRSVTSDPGSEYKQRIELHAWEHADFLRQMSNYSMMNDYCGEGFREMYRGEPGSTSLKKKDDLLLWCLIAQGHHDGYVKYDIQTIRSPLGRGRKGVAARYIDQERIHSDSFLLLPIHDIEDLKQQKRTNKLQPSTMVGFAGLEWLRVNANLGEVAYTRLFEEFLFEWITKEEARWKLFNAACSKEDRQRLAGVERLVATTCSQDNNKGESEDAKEEECCSFFDPSLKPVRARLQEEEEEEE